MNEVDAALAELGSIAPASVDDARAALEWLTGGESLEWLTQERLQQFLWYGLPMKWLTDTAHHRRVVAALAQLLDLPGLRRYAAICRAPTTTEVLDAYERGDDDGKKAFRRAQAASGIYPPPLPSSSGAPSWAQGRTGRCRRRPSCSSWPWPAGSSSPAPEVGSGSRPTSSGHT